MISSEVLDERLKFLDPELKATHSRIDILETICQANTDRIEAILQASPNNSSKHARKRLNGLNAGERLLPVLLLFLWLFCFLILFSICLIFSMMREFVLILLSPKQLL